MDKENRDRKATSRATYSVNEVADMLGIGRNAAYAAAGRGEIPTLKIGKRLLVPKSAFQRLLAIEAPSA